MHSILKTICLLFIFMPLLSGLGGYPAASAAEVGSIRPPVKTPLGAGEVIVQLRSESLERQPFAAFSLAMEAGGRVMKYLNRHQDILLMKMEDVKSSESFLASILSDPRVLHAEPNITVSIPELSGNGTLSPLIAHESQSSALPGDPDLTWGFQDIMADLAPPFPSSAPMVAVVDTGVDPTHPELLGKVISGPDFYNNDDDPFDDHGHGTHVAGIVAANAGNGMGSAGISPTSKILAIKVLGSTGSGTIANVIQGIYEASDHPDVRVINLSLGSQTSSDALHDAIDYAVGKGKLVVAAAGNSQTDRPFFPAFWSTDSKGLLSVAANDFDRCRAWFSNYGYWVNIAAPGVGIFSTLPGGGYASWSGTSMAAPFVSAAAVRLLEKTPDLPVQELAAALKGSGDPLTFDGSCWMDDWSEFSHLNLARAMGADNGDPLDAEPPAVEITGPTKEEVYDTQEAVVALEGMAWDNMELAEVKWSTSTGKSGKALGTDSWEIPSILLSEGENTVTVMAVDASGNQGTDQIKVNYTPDPAEVRTLNFQINDPLNDSFEKNYNGINLPAYRLAKVGKGYINGFRFGGLDIPQGAILISAFLELHSWNYSDRDINILYTAEATDNAAPFSKERYDLSSRPRTQASVQDQPGPWIKGDFNRSPDLSEVLQEIVNRPGWRSGNTVNLLVIDQGSPSYRSLTLYEKDAENAAKLIVTYRLPGDETDVEPPGVAIEEPLSEAGGDFHSAKPFLTLKGSAWDNVLVSRVTWETDRGDQGVATGTWSWTAEGLPLQEGINTITVKAFDPAGNKGSAVLNVMYEPDPDGKPIKVEYPIVTGADDAWEKTYNGLSSTSNKNIYLSDAYIDGFRFDGVQVPQGATITKAVLMLHCRLYHLDIIGFLYSGEKAATSAPFTGKAYDLSSRGRTSTEVNELSYRWAKNSYNMSTDLSAIIQEIVDQPDWQTGNAMSLMVETWPGAKRMITSYEYDPESPVILKIEYKP